MRTQFIQSILALLLTTAALTCDAFANQKPDHFFNLGFRELSQITVTSVSKYVEPYITSPSTVYTIDASDIKYSGAKKLTDIFRMIPGVDVADINAFYTGVQSRGFMFVPKYARQMLVLIDGRTVYTPQINATFWDQIPVFLENIDRVEVIRGPNAALYGANAFNGVINIVTKEAHATRGGLLSLTTGSRGSSWSTLRYGGGTKNLATRLTAGYHETDGFSRVHDHVRRPQLTLRCDYTIDDSSALSFLGGYTGGDRELADGVDPEVTSFFLMTKYRRTLAPGLSLSAQLYHDYRNAALTPFNFEDKVQETDVELQLNLDRQRYHLVWGIGYRYDAVKQGLLSGTGSRGYRTRGPHHLRNGTANNNIFKSFVHGTYRLSRSVHVSAALMVEDNGFIGTKYSPRASLVYSPSENHSFRLAVSKAYRTPSFIEEKADLAVPFPLPPFYIAQQGNSRLRPERIVALEFGYRGSFSDNRLQLNIEAFYNDVNNVIVQVKRSRRLDNTYDYRNFADNHIRGIETSLIWNIRKWWRLTCNYTYQEASDDYLKGLVIAQKAGLGSRFFLPRGFTANIQLYFVDRLHFEQEAWVGEATVKDYTRLDVRVGKTLFQEKVEIALIGQNLLDPRHYEYPPTLSAGEANRMFLMELSYRF